jgi:hypothetical protein
MTEQKTVPTAASVEEYLLTLAPNIAADSRTLIDIMQRVTGNEPVLMGGIIGFGQYYYQYSSGHKGHTIKLGFAPRKDKLTLYLMPGASMFAELMSELGKHKIGKGCLYIKRLSDVNLAILEQICTKTLEELGKLYTFTN